MMKFLLLLLAIIALIFLFSKRSEAASVPKLGDTAPDFRLVDQQGKMKALSDFSGQWVVLYFYPKDDTPGCTTEACNFRDNIQALSDAGLVVLGVSADSVKSHKKFADKYTLPFPLLSDENKGVCEAYGVWGKKKFMGREYMGISRMSFLIDEKGNLAKIYEDVKPKEHVDEVKTDIK
jgi:peroxiredoxin Q/BCP